MMYRKKSDARRKLNAIAIVPVFALALGVSAIPAVRAAVSTISSSEAMIDKNAENHAAEKKSAQVFKVVRLNNHDDVTTVKIKADNVGNHLSVSGGTFTTNGKTYKAKSLQSSLENGVANITATFPFIDEFENTRMTLMINGYEIPFNLSEFENNAQVVNPQSMPQYPGGDAAMMQAIMSKVRFPDPARVWKDGASGLTVVGFTVQADGSMEDFKLISSSGYGDLDAYAIQAIKDGLTVKWEPGKLNGKPVAVKYAIPIRYKQK